MDPNDNRIIVQLLNTCFICRRMYVNARDLNRYLHEDHAIPIVRYNRPEPLHIEMIPTEQYIYLNTLAPNSDNVPQHAVFVAIRHACSLCHSHYPTLERLFRHMEAHFRAETQDGQDDEIDELDLTFQFFDDHPCSYRPNQATSHQQEDVAEAFEDENGGFPTDDGLINEEGFHSDNEDENSRQQDTGHPTSGMDSQNSVDDDCNEETANND